MGSKCKWPGKQNVAGCGVPVWLEDSDASSGRPNGPMGRQIRFFPSPGLGSPAGLLVGPQKQTTLNNSRSSSSRILDEEEFKEKREKVEGLC